VKLIAWGKKIDGINKIYTEDIHFKIQAAYIEDEAKRLQDEYKMQELLLKIADAKLRKEYKI